MGRQSRWAGGVIVAIIVFLLQIRGDKAKEKKEFSERLIRSCDTLLNELEDHNIALNTKRHTHTLNRKERIYYVNAYLNTSAYESILHSGLFTFFLMETQQDISELYLRVIMHNRLTAYKDQFQDMLSQYSNSPYYAPRLLLYERRLTNREIEIRRMLPVVKKQIVKEKVRRYS